MRRDFFLIVGHEGRKKRQRAAKPATRKEVELNLDILNESPCVRCELFVENKSCPHRKGCSKIEEFQGVAASHRTLSKFQDIWSIAKI
ncbi:MAG: hypothetical protein SWE60_21025 [Thermodesulfobacteriota bacterium]|nr:hypothetical protein [Thermodesulfobacteriota bacterium]